MTPKEKAEELVGTFMQYTPAEVEYEFPYAKKCALIAVDEIIKANPIIPLQFMIESEAIDAAVEYWQQVKEEIEKL